MILALILSFQFWSSAQAAPPSLAREIAELSEAFNSSESDLPKAVEHLKALRERIQKEIAAGNAENAATQLQLYSDLVRAGVRGLFLTQAPEGWNLRSMRESLSIDIPTDLFNRATLLAEIPSELTIVFQKNDVTRLSLTDELVLSSGLRVLLRKLDEKNYETSARCLLGYSFAVNYANAALVSRGTLTTDISQLDAVADKPFCMQETLANLSRRQIQARLVRLKNVVVRKELLDLLPDATSALPPVAVAALNRKMRTETGLTNVSSTPVTLLLRQDLIFDRQKSDNAAVLSKDEVTAIGQATAGLDVSFLRGEEKFLTVFDQDLLAKIKELAKEAQEENLPSDSEIERRLRLSQILFLREAAALTVPGLNFNGLITQLPRILNMSLDLSLRATLLQVLPGIIANLDDSHANKFDEIKDEAMQRHIRSMQASGLYNQWLNQAIEKLKKMLANEDVLKLEADGFAKTIQAAAQDIEAKTGEHVPDEKLPYSSQMVLVMLKGEIDKSSSRVQRWFKYLENSGQYRDQVRTQGEVEAYARQAVKQPELCDIKQISYIDRAGIFWEETFKPLFSGSAPKAPTTIDQNLLDCQRFVRLSTLANLRKTEGVPQNMSEVVRAMDHYWSQANRKTLMAFYRKLLRLEIVEKFRLLDVTVQDNKTLASLLNTAGGSLPTDMAVGAAKTNILANMKELLAADNLQALSPLIVRGSLLDAAFAGSTGLLNPDQGGAGISALPMSEMIKTQKIEDLSSLRKTRDSRYDRFIALARFHADLKDRLKIATESQRKQWDAVYGRGTDGILAVLGLVIGRYYLTSLLSGKIHRPLYSLSQQFNDYVTTNRYLGRGYFTFLTAIFAADAGVQQFVGIPGIEAMEARDNRYAFSEATNAGQGLLNANTQLNHSLQNSALIEDARSRRNWGIALTAIPLLPMLASPVGRLFEGLMTGPLVRTDLYWRRIQTSSPELFAREMNSLRLKTDKRMNRIMLYNKAELQALGLDLSQAPKELLNIEKLKSALKAIEDGTDLAARVRARAAYRKLVRELYEEMGAYANGSPYVFNIYSEIYGGRGNRQYIGEVVKEFEKVVLGL